MTSISAPGQLPSRRRGPRALAAALFPGSRAVWFVAGGVLAVFVAVTLVWTLIPRDYYTGTNSVRVWGPVATLHRGEQLCVPGLQLPAGTGRLQMGLSSGGAPAALALDVRTAGGLVRSRASATTGAAIEKVAFPIGLRADEPDAVPATVCLRVERGDIVVGGDPGLPGNLPAPRVDGVPQDVRVAVWYLPPAGERRSLLASLPDVIARAAVLRPGIVGPWTYVALIFLLTPLLAYAGMRLLAVTAAGERTRRVPLAGALALIAFGNAAGWALVTPAFDAPDEPEHFAYAQYLAETHRPPDAPASSPRPAYSQQEAVDLDASMIKSYLAAVDGRPPWLGAVAERDLERRIATLPRAPRRDDGGGPTAASVHAPLYYALTLPAYATAVAAGDGSSFDALFLMRLVSALLGALTVACVFLAIRELLPRQPVAAVAGALLVAFQPMVAFMSGAVNNDVGVNAVAALLTWLMLRGLRRGLTVRLGLGIAAAAVALPLMKGTGYELYPALGLALVAIGWRQLRAGGGLRGALASWRPQLMPWLACGGFAALLGALWVAYAHHEGRGVFTTPSGGSPTSAATATGTAPTAYLSYLWQTFLPRLPFMHKLVSPGWPAFDIYVERGFAAFGWYSIVFPHWVYVTIAAVALALGALALATAVREWTWVRRHVAELLVLGLILFGVFGGVAYAYYAPDAAGRLSPSEQGRYAFTALIPLVTIALAGCYAFGRQRAALVASGLAAAMIGFGIASQAMALATYYT